MNVTTINDWQSLQKLAGSWSSLLKQSRANSIFRSWQWVEAWWRTMDGRFELHILVVRDASGALAGIAPFYRGTIRLCGVINYRMLRLMGDAPTGAEYSDWLLREDCEQQAARAIASSLVADHSWDFLWMPLMSGWSGSRSVLQDACQSAGLDFASHATDFSAINLPGQYSAYEESLSKNKRSELRRRKRAVFEDLGGELVHCQSQDDLPMFLNALFELHESRWSSLGKRGAFERKPLERRFYETFAPIALQQGWLRITAIRIAGSFKAVEIGYVYNGQYLALQGGFDPTSAPGLGNALLARLIEKLIAEGVHTFDFLCTSANYKQQFGAKTRSGWDVLVGRRSVQTAAVRLAGLSPRGKYLRVQTVTT
jgi:CelD/BcsL family acetyltransferase involved in cellulose biosynthesis